MKYFRLALAWILYIVGHLVSRPMCWWDLGFLYPIYNRLMTWSVALDKEGKIWKYVDEDEEK